MPSGRRKHVPLRTCIACQEKRPKRELIRVVRRPEGTLEIDLKGKVSGRGAYVCYKQECWEVVLEPKRLGRALKCQVGAEEIAALRAAIFPLLAEKGTDEVELQVPLTGDEHT